MQKKQRLSYPLIIAGISFIAISLSPSLLAQVVINEGLQSMDEESIDTRPAQEKITSGNINESAVSVPNQKVFIYNNQPVNTETAATNNNAQKNQVDVEAASPMNNYKTQNLRRMRKEAEMDTEVKIVEKLEASRLEDEQTRAARLFGERWRRMRNQNPAQQQQYQNDNYDNDFEESQPQNFQPIQKSEKNKEDSVSKKDIQEAKEDIIFTMRKNISELQEHNEVSESASEKKFYISGRIGSGSYLNTYNTESKMAAGFSVGMEMGNNLMFEVGIDKSQHTIDPDYFVYKDLDQYNANFLAKYALINSRIKPIIGAGLSYVYRSYSQNTQSSNNYYNSNLKYDDYAKTHAIDAALYAGAEFSLTDNFSVGASYKYMKNLTSWGNKDYFYQKCSDCQPVESLSNSQFTIDAKLRF